MHHIKFSKINITFSERFLKDTKKLQKKYRNIKQDLLDFVSLIEKGEIIGDKLQNLSKFDVYKARMQNSSIKSGKSGGFRIIYYIRKKEDVYMITIYSKSTQGNIDKAEILNILKQENL